MFNMEYYSWLMPAYQQLVSLILQQRFSQAWLISYVTGSGENELIAGLMATLLCQSKKEAACGLCHSCLLCKAGNHPDFHHVTVEKDKTLISISQIRDLIGRVYEHAQQGGAKTIWIENSALMSESASNALLKTLEEPPSETYFILSEQSPKAIKSTIRSRCHGFYLPTPDLTQSIRWLQQHYSDYTPCQLETALLLSRKAPLAAKQLLKYDNWHKRQQFCQLVKTALLASQFWLMLDCMDNSGDFLQQNTWFCSLLLDVIKEKKGAGHSITNRDQRELLDLLNRYDSEMISRLYTLWQTAAQQIRSIPGVNEQLIVANLLAQCEVVVI